MGAVDDPDAVADDAEAATNWVLVRQTPKIDELGLNAAVAELRDVDAEERARILAAEAAFDRFGARWGHTQMIRRASAFGTAVDALRGAQLRALGAINQAHLERVQSAFVDFVDHVASWVSAGQLMTGEPATVASSVANLPALKASRAFAADAGRVVVAFVGQQGRPPVLAAMRQDEREQRLGDAHDVVALVNATVEACEVFASADLVAAEDELLAAGRRLLCIQAEVVYGYPALAPAPFDPVAIGKLQLRAIGVPKVTPVMYALELAQTQLAAWRTQTAARNEGAAPVDPPGDNTGLAAATPAEEKNRRNQPPDVIDGDEIGETAIADAGGAEGAAHESDTERADTPTTLSEAPPPRTSPPAPPRVVDLGGLLEEAVTFSEEAEQRWFKALEQSMHGDANDLRGRIQSLLMVLNSEVQAGEAMETATGLSAALPALPLSAHDANLLEVDPVGQQRVTQHSIGLVAVVENLVRALEELHQPTAVQLQFPSGAATTWWSPDIFARVRDAAMLAIRFIRDPQGDAVTAKTNMLDSSVAAWLAGLPEAAALYVFCSLDPTAERQGPLAGAFMALHSIVTTLAAGTPVSLDALVPVVNVWLQEVHRRAQDPARSREDVSP